jgi:hypothetical protein
MIFAPAGSTGGEAARQISLEGNSLWAIFIFWGIAAAIDIR